MVPSLSSHQSHTRTGGNDVSGHTRDLAHFSESRAKMVSEKRGGLGRACHQDVILTSPSLHAGLSCATQSVKESRALQCRHSREGGSLGAPRVVPGHARRSLRDVDVLQQRAEKGPSRQGSAKSGRTEVLQQPGACRFHAVAKGCSRSSGSQHDTL